MRKLTLTATLALLFMATPNLHAATGTYIDCIHGCPDLFVCIDCCNEKFSSILETCDANQDNCEDLCPPGNMDCLDACMTARNLLPQAGQPGFRLPALEGRRPAAGYDEDIRVQGMS
ncbi:hypothetical protein [Desulfonatronum sp. SC1]|uniref:hypothetical protein n=1 Tax=Desulfonatronum sp. SC1 TaxID=2109626 RepID=UPI000D31370C|nr:hypothetical protein [Desulfonatronum sp. SC1]PTN33042.1 hypothetical protein C6366_15495 [Desulfonatronum sp. SC1]